MKNVKRFLAIILSLVMSVTILAGCGQEEQTIDVKLDENGKLILQKDLELSVWYTHGTDYTPTTPIKNNVVEDWLIEKTRVKIDNVIGNGGSEWEAAMTRFIAGDNFPDLVYCGGGQGATHFAVLGEADLIWELTPEMMQKYAPDIWNKVPEDIWEKISVDGKIYGIPYCFPVSKDIDPELSQEAIDTWGTKYSTVGNTIWVRDDVLKMIYPDALSYEEAEKLLADKNAPIGDELMDVCINSKEEFLELAKKIQALGLTSGGKTVYPYGYVGSDCWVPLAQFGAQLFGFSGHNYTSSWNTVTDSASLPILEPILKETAKFQNQMLRDKLIDPESLINSSSVTQEKVLAGQYAMVNLAGVAHPPSINQKLKDAGKDYRYRPLFTNVPRAEGYEVIAAAPTWTRAIGILKTVKAEDVPQVLNWMNTQFTDEFEEVRYWGPKEAGLYTDNPDGTRTFKDERFNQRFIYHDTSALKPEDCLGLDGNVGMLSLKFMSESEWQPMFYNGVRSYQMTVGDGGGASFPAGSQYLVEPTFVPTFNVWAPEFAGIEEVQTYWSARSQWEEPFKTALAANTEEEFEQKWQKAVNNLNSIVDVDAMLKKMTEAAKAAQ